MRERERERELTQVFNGVVALLAVHPDSLCVGASHAVANDVAPYQDVGVEGRGPAHDDAAGEGSHVEGTGLVGNLTL